MNTEDFQRLENKVDLLTNIMEQINTKLNRVTIIAREPIAPRPVADKKKRFRIECKNILRLSGTGINFRGSSTSYSLPMRTECWLI